MAAVDKPIPPCGDNEYEEFAWAKTSPEAKFAPIKINRPKVGDMDVKFEMLYCGVCHSDVHLANNDLGGSMYPMVPGHELIGKVVEVGSKVTKVKVGDTVGVGCISDSCLDCTSCSKNEEMYCKKGMNVHTYNDKKKYDHIGGNQDTQTFGGYSGSNCLHEHFVMKIPDAIPAEKAGPILCAGITLYDPLRFWGATKGEKMTIGIVGIGGLGTMGIKLAKALGHTVYAISTSPHKKDLAHQKGADHFVVSSDPESVKAATDTCDLILNTVSMTHDVNVYVPILTVGGTIVQLGLVTTPHTVSQLPLIFQRKSIAGSLIGGIKATEECLELCAKHGIAPDTQLIEADKLDWAYEQLLKNSDGIRYVVDIKKSAENKAFMPA